VNPWCEGRIIEQRMQDLKVAGAGRRRRADSMGRGAQSPGRAGARVTVWCGYRLINLGSRLLRPALLASAGA
jgi:hypothetical protein